MILDQFLLYKISRVVYYALLVWASDIKLMAGTAHNLLQLQVQCGSQECWTQAHMHSPSAHQAYRHLPQVSAVLIAAPSRRARCGRALPAPPGTSWHFPRRRILG